jgi:hypothetical protein
MSEAFSCSGQEAKLIVRIQPRLTLEGDKRDVIPPVVSVVDEQGSIMPLANAKVQVSIGRNVNSASFTDNSMTTVAASGGSAVFDKIWLTRAATRIEPWTSTPDRTTGFAAGYTLFFSAPGFETVESSEFFVLPVLSLTRAPVSEITLVVKQACTGYPVLDSGEVPPELPECSTVLSRYIQPGDVVRAASMDIDLACTDFDSPGEVVRNVNIGGVSLSAGGYNPGPWPGCAFAGCRNQCGSNMRYVARECVCIYIYIHIHVCIHMYIDKCVALEASWCCTLLKFKKCICTLKGVNVKACYTHVKTHTYVPAQCAQEYNIHTYIHTYNLLVEYQKYANIQIVFQVRCTLF